jgi:hypothetical protein
MEALWKRQAAADGNNAQSLNDRSGGFTGKARKAQQAMTAKWR